MIDAETKRYIDREMRRAWYDRVGDELYLWAGISMVAAYTLGGWYAIYFGVVGVSALVAGIIFKEKGDNWA